MVRMKLGFVGFVDAPQCATALRISGFFNIAGNLNHVLPLPLPPISLPISLSLFFITYRDAHVANRINLLWNICHHCHSKFYNGTYTNLDIRNALFFSSFSSFGRSTIFSLYSIRTKIETNCPMKIL